MFIPAPPTTGARATVPHMRLNTLEKVRDCLRDRSPAVCLRPSRARALDRMLELSRA